MSATIACRGCVMLRAAAMKLSVAFEAVCDGGGHRTGLRRGARAATVDDRRSSRPSAPVWNDVNLERELLFPAFSYNPRRDAYSRRRWARLNAARFARLPRQAFLTLTLPGMARPRSDARDVAVRG